MNRPNLVFFSVIFLTTYIYITRMVHSNLFFRETKIYMILSDRINFFVQYKWLKKGGGGVRGVVVLIFSFVRIIGMVYSTDITSSHISHFNFMRYNFKLIDLKKNGAERRQNFHWPAPKYAWVFCKRGRRRGVIQYYVWGLYLGEIYEP